MSIPKTNSNATEKGRNAPKETTLSSKQPFSCMFKGQLAVSFGGSVSFQPPINEENRQFDGKTQMGIDPRNPKITTFLERNNTLDTD